jgi:hypothetical protein
MSKAALLVLFAAGCQLDLEVDEVRLTVRDIEVKPGGGLRAAKQSFAFDDLGAIQQLVDQGAEITFLGAELSATSGIDSMSFVEETHVALASADPMSELPPLSAYDCAGNCKHQGNKLEMTGGKQRASDYVRSGALLLDIDLVGALPGKPWTMDLDVVLGASLDYKLEP